MELYNTLSTQLELDNTGKIKTYSGTDSKKDRIDLYLKTLDGSVPFWDFGSRILLQIFKSTNADDLTELVVDLVKDIAEYFFIEILDYEAEVFEDRVKLRLYLYNNEIFDLDITQGILL